MPCGLACLLLDNVAAYHYLDRAGGRGGAPLAQARVQAAVCAQLRALQQRWRVPLVASKHLVLPSAGGGAAGGQQGQQQGHEPREVMLKAWQDLVTHRLLLAVQGGGGGGGGGEQRVARWLGQQQQQQKGGCIRFVIDAAGVQPC